MLRSFASRLSLTQSWASLPLRAFQISGCPGWGIVPGLVEAILFGQSLDNLEIMDWNKDIHRHQGLVRALGTSGPLAGYPDGDRTRLGHVVLFRTRPAAGPQRFEEAISHAEANAPATQLPLPNAGRGESRRAFTMPLGRRPPSGVLV